MEALAARGNLAEALRVYDRLRVLLRDELGATPAPEITALNERLLIAGRKARGGRAPRRPWARRSRSRALLARLEQRPVRRPRARAGAGAGSAGAPPRPARAVSSCSRASPASARPGWRRASPPPRTRPARPCCTGGSTRRRSFPTSRSWRRCATTRPTAAIPAASATSRRSRRSSPSWVGESGRQSTPTGERENRRYQLFEAVADAARPGRVDAATAARDRGSAVGGAADAAAAAPRGPAAARRAADGARHPAGRRGRARRRARAAARRPQPRAGRASASRCPGLDEAETAALVGDAEAGSHSSRAGPRAIRSSSRRCSAAAPRCRRTRPGSPRASRPWCRAASRALTPRRSRR